MKKIPVRHLNSPHSELNSSDRFIIRKLEDLFTEEDMVQKLHRHDFYFILAIKKGNGNHEVDFVDYKVLDYSVFIVRPGQVHQLNLKEGSIGFIIQFNSELYSSIDKTESKLLQKVSSSDYYQLNADSFSRLNVLLTSIFNEYESKPKQYIEVIKSNLKIFFIELTRLKNFTNRNTKDYYVQERLEEFLSLLDTHISTCKQVSQYAEMLHLSGYQLNSITKQTLDKTASKLINEQIILESKRYLLATSNQISYIAHYLGYEDVSYFIRFFKKHTGFSPRAFRENFK